MADRGDILTRRLSDKVTLTLAGISQLDFDDDVFVEAIQTTIQPTGELEQTLWVQAESVVGLVSTLSTPTGLALTTADGDITATWDAVTEATGYILEWRVEGSDDVWDTVEVAAPPHTFTP